MAVESMNGSELYDLLAIISCMQRKKRSRGLRQIQRIIRKSDTSEIVKRILDDKIVDGAVLLGMVALIDTDPKQLMTFVQAIMASKVPVNVINLESLGPIFARILTKENIHREIFTPASKLFLRAPEVILSVLVKIVDSVSFDLSTSFTTLIESLMNLLKSSSESIRSEALKLIHSFALKSSIASKPAEIILSRAERVFCYTIMKDFKGIAPLLEIWLKKETNDLAYVALADAYASQLLQNLLTNGKIDLDIWIKSLQNSKVMVKKAFTLSIPTLLTSESKDLMTASQQQIIHTELESLLRNLEANLESHKVEALVVLEGLILFNPSRSHDWIYAPRFYTKLLSESTRFVNILLNSLQRGDDTPEIGVLMVWLSLSTTFQINNDLLRRLCHLTESSEIMYRAGTLIRKGLVEIMREDEVDCVWANKPIRYSKNPAQRIVNLLSAILPTKPSSDSDVQRVMVDFFITCNHPKLTSVYGADLWVTFCYKAGLNPSFIEGVENFIEDLLTFKSGDESLGGLCLTYHESYRAATFAALRLSCLVCASFIPKVLSWSQEMVSREEYLAISHQDILIWQTQEGTLFLDPLVKTEIVPSKGLTKDQKWDLELKQELLAKRGKAGDTKKRSKAEEEVVERQRVKEREVRNTIETLSREMKYVLMVVQGVVDTRDFALLEPYTSNILDLLIDLIRREYVEHSCGSLAGRDAIAVYIQFSKAVLVDLEVDLDVLLYTLLLTIGVDESAVPPHIRNTFLSNSLSTLLQQITELPALTNASFTVIFPILSALIYKQGRTVDIKEKSYVDLVIQSADILLIHTSVEGGLYMPRGEMVGCLLALLEGFPGLRVSTKGGLLGLAVTLSQMFEEDEEEVDEVVKVVTQLVEGLLSVEECVREACLSALIHFHVLDSLKVDFEVRVFLLQFDISLVATEATLLWRNVYEKKSLDEGLVVGLVQYITHPNSTIQMSASKALCSSLAVYPHLTTSILHDLFQLYSDLSVEYKAEYDNFGMLLPSSYVDLSGRRMGIALALDSLKPVLLEMNDVLLVFDFLIHGKGLDDTNELVQSKMLQSGLSLVSSKTHLQSLLPIFEAYLNSSNGSDRVQEAVVILMGTLAQHLETNDARIASTIKQLLLTLRTPSETVQIAVSECLPLLIKVCLPLVPSILEELMEILFGNEEYGYRRGAAYGVAGVIKGTGLKGLKEYNVISILKSAVEDKRSVFRRQGALFCFETLSFTLGRTFEPYVSQLLPFLLVCYGDANGEIRKATEDACRVIMGGLSGHCVKLLMPTLLKGVEEKAFRSKVGAIEVMASMSHLAPKQLGQSLPFIVPKVCGTLGDSHQKVQEAARLALVQFGRVIKNKEILDLVPILIQALVDPNKKTVDALDTLLGTTFVHYIDAPSLALLVPIVLRGMKERSAETKKKAAQIVGNMASLTDPVDLSPYLKVLLGPLKEVLVDPVPEARATAARAFGRMVKRLGEAVFPGLVNELLELVKSETSSVDRSGAAQGLSEVLYGVGVDRLSQLIPLIINNANSVNSTTREGYTTLLIYLPTVFGEAFTGYLGQIVPTILQGLADEVEPVREAALLVGKVVVRNYAKTAISLLLPELQKGLFDNNWRIRQSSVSLIGGLVFRIAGITQQMDSTEGEGVGTEVHREALRVALGGQYNSILAALFVVRQDGSGQVRQTAVGVWKAVVANTPKTLKVVLSTLMDLVLNGLTSGEGEMRGVCARTLGDLVKRLGDDVLVLIVPILEEGIHSEEIGERVGVCLVIREMLGKTSNKPFLDGVVDVILVALQDKSERVRGEASATFNSLVGILGQDIVVRIVPVLLQNNSLEGLKGVMSVQSHVVLPMILPSLLDKPETLSVLLSVSGSALNRHLDTILPVLLENDCLEMVASSVEGDGVQLLLDLLLASVEEGPLKVRNVALKGLVLIIETSLESFELMDFVELSISQSNELDSLRVLDGIVARVGKEGLSRYVRGVERGLRALPDAVSGFNTPKALLSTLAVLLQGLVSSSSDYREQSAYCLADIIRKTDVLALKAYVTQITGPLIRVIGERLSTEIKVAILTALSLLLKKVAPSLKPFLPQLQRSFVKCLLESQSAKMRVVTVSCLNDLITLQTRLDPLVIELLQGIKSTHDDSLVALYEALRVVLKRGVNTDTAKVVLKGYLSSSDVSHRRGSAQCLAVIVGLMGSDGLTFVDEIVATLDTSWESKHALIILWEALVSTTDLVADSELIFDGLKDSKTEIVQGAIGVALLTLLKGGDDNSELLLALVGATNPDSEMADNRRLALQSLETLSEQRYDVIDECLEKVVDILMMSVRDSIVPVKMAAERALGCVLGVREEDVAAGRLKRLDRAVNEYYRRVLARMTWD